MIVSPNEAAIVVWEKKIILLGSLHIESPAPHPQNEFILSTYENDRLEEKQNQLQALPRNANPVPSRSRLENVVNVRMSTPQTQPTSRIV